MVAQLPAVHPQASTPVTQARTVIAQTAQVTAAAAAAAAAAVAAAAAAAAAVAAAAAAASAVTVTGAVTSVPAVAMQRTSLWRVSSLSIYTAPWLSTPLGSERWRTGTWQRPALGPHNLEVPLLLVLVRAWLGALQWYIAQHYGICGPRAACRSLMDVTRRRAAPAALMRLERAT